MPNWMVLLGLTVSAWLLLTVVGGIAIGRLLGFIERRHAPDGSEPAEATRREERRAA